MNKLEAEVEEKEEEQVCIHYGSPPRECDGFGPELLKREASMHFCEEWDGVIVIFNDYGVCFANMEMRKSLYHMFTYVNYGHLGRGVRIPLM